MGNIYEALGDLKQAGQSYEKAVEARPNNPLVIRVLADFYVRNNDIRHAAPLIKRLMSGEVPASESDLVGARRMMATILAAQGYAKLKEAIELIDRNLASPLGQPQDKRLKMRLLLADPRRAHDPEVLELAKSLVNTGWVEPEPDDRFQLARLYLGRDDWESCRDEMAKLVNGSQSNPAYQAVYVRMLLDHEQLADAELWLERLQRVANPGLTVPLRAELLHRRKEWGKVPECLAAYIDQKDAEPADRLDRTFIAAQLLEHLGSLLTGQREKGEAMTYFEKAREWYASCVEKRPGSEMLLVGFDSRCGKVEEALQGLDRYGEKADPREVFKAVGAIVSRSRPSTTPAQLREA